MKPTVIIDNLVYRQIMHWVNKSQDEVSGLGTLVCEPDGVFRVNKVMLLPQTNGATHTDIEPEHVGKLMYQMRDSGDLRFWWHSHVKMPVFWSGTDMDTIKKLGQGGWFLSTVFNQMNEMKSAFYAVEGQTTPWGTSALFIDELATKVEPFVEDNAARWDAEYTENVTANRRDFRQPYAWQGGNVGAHGWRGRDVSTVGGGLLNPLAKRPVGMSKREWKALKKARPTNLPRITHITETSAKIVPADDTDEYGFTQEERAFLARMGWDEHDIDELFELDVSPLEILKLAATDCEPSEVETMMRHSWSIPDILQHYEQVEPLPTDDGPVMDKCPGGAGDVFPQ